MYSFTITSLQLLSTCWGTFNSLWKLGKHVFPNKCVCVWNPGCSSYLIPPG